MTLEALQSSLVQLFFKSVQFMLRVCNSGCVTNPFESDCSFTWSRNYVPLLEHPEDKFVYCNCIWGFALANEVLSI